MENEFRYCKKDVWNPDTDFEVRQYFSEKENDFFVVGNFLSESDAEEYVLFKNYPETHDSYIKLQKRRNLRIKATVGLISNKEAIRIDSFTRETLIQMVEGLK